VCRIAFEKPKDWPFKTLKLGEYFSLARQAARIVRVQQVCVADAVDHVLAGRTITNQERTMLVQKVRSIIFLGLEDE